MPVTFEINFYRTYRARRVATGEEVLRVAMTGESVVIAIMSIFVLISAVLSCSSSRRNLKEMERELFSTRSEVERIRTEASSVSPSLSEMAKIMGARISWGDKLSEIGRSVPSGLWISSLSLSWNQERSGKSLKIEGFALGGSNGLQAVLEFASRLRVSPTISRDFGEVVLVSTSSRKEGDVELTAFEIVCNPKGGGG
jgi:Fe-S cluster biogenesis protein NfuA